LGSEEAVIAALPRSPAAALEALEAVGGARTVTALQGFPVAFVGIEADVDRAIASPGKAAAEALLALDLAARRPRDRAGWPRYHRAVLT